MQTISRQLDRAFRAAIRDAFDLDADPVIVPSQNEKFGDYQSSAAMGLARSVAEKTGQKTNPRIVAEQILAKLDLGEMVDDRPTIAGPGFMNVRLSPAWLARQLQSIAKDDRLGVDRVDRPQNVIVEYSSPNIAKQMHVGHVRTTILGDAIARVFEFLGHRVRRQNHIGDWGTQFGKVVLAIWHICMAEHRFDPDWPTRTGAALLEAEKSKDISRRAAIIADVAKWHQSCLDDDPDGVTIFMPYLKNQFVPSLARIEPIYQFVSAVEATPEAKQHIIRHVRSNSSLADQSKEITADLQQGEKAHKLNIQEYVAWEKVRHVTLESCQAVYERLGVDLKMTDVRGESEYDKDLPEVVAELRELGLAEESDGAIVVFVDGPDKPPLIIEKSAGHGYLYATTDLAAVRYRATKLHADRVLYVVDARQSQHFRQVFETARRAGWGRSTSYEHAAFGMILGADNKPMKTREGDNVKLVELLDEAEARGYALVDEKSREREIQLGEEEKRNIGRAVGIGAIKYADLSKDRTTDYVFNWDSMLATMGNTGPYLQYAYARIRSIFRKAETAVSLDRIVLDSPHEQALAKQILRLSDTIDVVSRDLKPHVLCTYLYDLATRFSGFYENCPVLQSDEPTRSSRLALCEFTARTLAKGLDLLGIEHPERM